MLRVRDIMTRDVVSVSPDLSIRDAMLLFSEHHIGGAPVVANNKLIGVVTLTDLVELASGMPGVPTERPNEAEGTDIEDPLAWVDDEASPVAFYTDMWDDSGVDAAQRMAGPDSPEWNALEEHTVGEAMNRRVSSLAPDTSVDEAAQLMRRAGIHRVLVIENGRLVGLVSTKDISNAVADHRIGTTRFVFGRPALNRGLQ